MAEPSERSGDAPVDPAVHHVSDASPWPFFAPFALFVLFLGLVVHQPLLMLGGLVMGVIVAVGWGRDAMGEWRRVDGADRGAGHVAHREPGHLTFRPMAGVLATIAATAALATIIPALPTTAAAAPAASGATATVSGGSVTVVADDVRFAVGAIDAPAGSAFTIQFENKDSLPHDIAIYDSSKLGTTLFRGAIVDGPKTVAYAVPALPAGTYWFQCDIHPGSMNGTFVVK